MLDKLKDQLIIHEGLRLFPYECTSGKTTIGIGRNLEDIGITEEEAHILLETDIKRVQRQLDKLWPHWRMMVEPRQAALINFVFNVGIGTAGKFKNAMEALKLNVLHLHLTDAHSFPYGSEVRGRHYVPSLCTGQLLSFLPVPCDLHLIAIFTNCHRLPWRATLSFLQRRSQSYHASAPCTQDSYTHSTSFAYSCARRGCVAYAWCPSWTCRRTPRPGLTRCPSSSSAARRASLPTRRA